MKKLITKSGFVLLVFLAFVTSFVACSKDDDTDNGSSKSPEELLSAAPWKILEERFIQVNTNNQGTSYYYKKGVTGNVANLDNAVITFNANNTGTFQLGSTNATTTWQFTNSDKTNLVWVITYSDGSKLTVNWENLSLAETTAKYSEYYTTTGGISSLASVTCTH